MNLNDFQHTMYTELQDAIREQDVVYSAGDEEHKTINLYHKKMKNYTVNHQVQANIKEMLTLYENDMEEKLTAPEEGSAVLSASGVLFDHRYITLNPANNKQFPQVKIQPFMGNLMTVSLLHQLTWRNTLSSPHTYEEMKSGKQPEYQTSVLSIPDQNTYAFLLQGDSIITLRQTNSRFAQHPFICQDPWVPIRVDKIKSIHNQMTETETIKGFATGFITWLTEQDKFASAL